MSKRRKVDITLLVISIVSFLLMSVSFSLMPFGKVEDGAVSIMTYISGGMFWLFLILGIVFQIILSNRRKNWYIHYRIMRNPKSTRQKKGIISFFKNAYGTTADILFIAALTGLVASIVFFDGQAYICYVFISAAVFTFCMHCIFNGKIFYHIQNQDKTLKSIEKERNEHNKESV